MKVKVLIATVDSKYAGFISDNISEFHSDKIEVNVCTDHEGFMQTTSKRKYDVILIDPVLIGNIDLNISSLPILLWSDHTPDETGEDRLNTITKIRKHQRISAIVSSILECYAKVSKPGNDPDSRYANITAVWSPAGGAGKTTVSLAYAAANVAEGKDVFYLNLEDFSGVPGYFGKSGKSISSVFDLLDNNTGNVKMFIQGVSCTEDGITYLCSPENFEDMYILSNDNINELIESCAGLADELIVDLPCVYDSRTKKSFEVADKIFIVTGPECIGDAKLAQFKSQNDVYENIKDKVVFVSNKNKESTGATSTGVISLPYVNSERNTDVYRVLSETGFRM